VRSRMLCRVGLEATSTAHRGLRGTYAYLSALPAPRVQTPTQTCDMGRHPLQNDREAVLLVERTGYDMTRLQAAHGLPGWEVRTFVSGAIQRGCAYASMRNVFANPSPCVRQLLTERVRKG